MCCLVTTVAVAVAVDVVTVTVVAAALVSCLVSLELWQWLVSIGSNYPVDLRWYDLHAKMIDT